MENAILQNGELFLIDECIIIFNQAFSFSKLYFKNFHLDNV